jgi:uncharacterized pyridoxamine 5'-phosphate oxidase family protein
VYTKENGPRFALFYTSKGSAAIEDMNGNKEVYTIDINYKDVLKYY